MKRTYNKLVRDKIPEIIEKSGEKAIIKILEDNEYRASLIEKAKEELWEVKTAESMIRFSRKYYRIQKKWQNL